MRRMIPAVATAVMPPLVLSVFPSFAIGGAQARFVTLANRLGRQFRHAIIAMDGDLGCAARLDPALDVAWPDIIIRKGDTSGNLRRFRRLLHDLRPDTMVTHNWGTIEWALANLLPLVRHVHVEDGFGPEERARQIPRRVWLRRLSLRGCEVVVPSTTLREIARDTWRIPPRRLHYIPNGVDLARFAPPATGRTPGARPTIGTVAALRPEKNLARLVHAFHRVVTQRPARLAIIGEGPERGALEALAGRLGIGDHVLFAGHMADPAPCYGTFDIFAISSDTEQMPLSLLEAMAAGLPVAATDVGDIRAMLAPENRNLVTPMTEEGLAAALDSLARDAGLRTRLGAANRARAEAVFDERAMVEAPRSLWLGASATAYGR
jgi:glycosyltransferase involved in cell wall biosynthesis